MGNSVNSSSARPTSTLVMDGEAIYEKQLSTVLERQHSGEFVAIEPSSGRHFLGETATATLVAARNAMPKRRFFLTRIGRGFAHRI